MALLQLIRNLKKSDYVEILCGSLENLPVAIAKLDYEERVKRYLKPTPTQSIKVKSSTTASLPKEDRQFIRKIKIALLILDFGHFY